VRRLSELLGATLRGPNGERVGRIKEVAASLEEEHPVVTYVITGGDWYPWSDVESLDPEPRLRVLQPRSAADGSHVILLDRHVLDSQIVDLQGKRVRRVDDVELADDEGRLRVVAVDVGAAALLRRLGLVGLARRARQRSIDWRSLHVVSRPAHGLQLEAPAAAVHRLSEPELAELVERLPPLHAEEVLARRGVPTQAPRRRRRSRFPLHVIRRRAP
jgi:magnesium transporter